MFRTIDKFFDGACGLEDIRELVERAQSAQSLAAEASQMEEKLTEMDTKYEHFQNLIMQCEEKSKSLDDQVRLRRHSKFKLKFLSAMSQNSCFLVKT